MFPSEREISRSNGKTGDNLSKPESPVQNGRVGTYANDTKKSHFAYKTVANSLYVPLHQGAILTPDLTQCF